VPETEDYASFVYGLLVRVESRCRHGNFEEFVPFRGENWCESPHLRLGQRAVHAKGLMLYIAYAAALAVMGLIAGVGYYWKKQQSVEISDSYGPALG
jgi:hypothetical protein